MQCIDVPKENAILDLEVGRRSLEATRKTKAEDVKAALHLGDALDAVLKDVAGASSFFVRSVPDASHQG